MLTFTELDVDEYDVTGEGLFDDTAYSVGVSVGDGPAGSPEHPPIAITTIIIRTEHVFAKGSLCTGIYPSIYTPV